MFDKEYINFGAWNFIKTWVDEIKISDWLNNYEHHVYFGLANDRPTVNTNFRSIANEDF